VFILKFLSSLISGIFLTYYAERPANSVQGPSGLDINTFYYIDAVIVNEVMLVHLPEKGKRDNSENDINNKFLSAGADIILFSMVL